MATIKSFTSLEQSKKLAEILPLESADITVIGKDNIIVTPYLDAKKSLLACTVKKDSLHPCWSLAALLGVLPQGYSLGNKKNNGKYYICMTCVKHDVIEYDEPIDACVEMIIKLHELNLL